MIGTLKLLYRSLSELGKDQKLNQVTFLLRRDFATIFFRERL